MKNIIIILFLFVGAVYGQTIYEIPVAAEGNSIELNILNNAEVPLTDVKVEAIKIPMWVKVTGGIKELGAITLGEEKIVGYQFDIRKNAEIGEEGTLTFGVYNNGILVSTKEIKIKVTVPQSFELFQNYPNPFNPSTKIEYSLPVEAHVTLKIFNVLGEEVMTLVNGTVKAGRQEAVFNAGKLASGMYIYRLEAGDYTSIKKMMLIK